MVAASTALTFSGRGARPLRLETEYSRRAAPATGEPPPETPKTSWPGLKLDPGAGVTMEPAKSTPGVAGLLMKKRVTRGTSQGL